MKKSEMISNILKNNNGYIQTNKLLKQNINKTNINECVKEGLIVRATHGVYMDPKIILDEYYVLQMKYPNAIYSHETALFLLGYTNYTPSNIEVTLPRGKTMRGDYKVHYISKKKYNVGITEIVTPYGNVVKAYDAERCICDILKSKEPFDLEQQNRILNYYFKSKNKNIDKLLEYSKKLKIYDKVNTIVGVMMKW